MHCVVWLEIVENGGFQFGVEWKLFRRSCLFGEGARHGSTRLSQLAEVGVKWTWI